MKFIEKVCLDHKTRIIYFFGIPIKYVKSFDEKGDRLKYCITFWRLKFCLYKDNSKKTSKNQTLKIDRNIKRDALISAKCINNLFNKINTLETIVLGTSEARCGFIEDAKSVNLGIDAQDLYYSYKLFEKYKNSILNLKNLILYYSLFSSGNDLDVSPQKYRTAFYKVLYDIPYKNKFAAIKNNIIKFEKKLYNLDSYIKKHISEIPNNIVAETSARYMTQKELENWALSESKLNIKNNMFPWFKALIKSAEEMNLNIYIVLTPRNPRVKGVYPPSNVLFKSVLEYVRGHDLIQIINAFDYDFAENDFTDLLHLTRGGAEKITKLINKSINGENR